MPKALDNKKGDWLISDAGLKSGKLMKEARKAGVKVITRLNSNFVVVRFGAKFRKEEILSNIKPIQRVIDGESYIIYPFKKCIWQGRTAGNLFLVRGAGYDDFIALFTTSLNTKPETVIRNEINKQQSQIDIEFPDGNIYTFGIRPSFWKGCYEFVDAQVRDKVSGKLLRKVKPTKSLAIDTLGYNVKTKGNCIIQVQVVKRNKLLRIVTFK